MDEKPWRFSLEPPVDVNSISSSEEAEIGNEEFTGTKDLELSPSTTKYKNDRLVDFVGIGNVKESEYDETLEAKQLLTQRLRNLPSTRILCNTCGYEAFSIMMFKKHSCVFDKGLQLYYSLNC